MAIRRQVLNAMDAVLAAGVKIDNVARWCRENGVTTRTFYRHKARVDAEGAWRERSRRPHRSPGIAGADLDAWIRKLRADLAPDNGADYIRDALTRIAADTGAPWSVPSRSTINRVLSRHGLLEANPAKRPRSSWRRFAFAQPRDCYQIDATVVPLAGGRTAVVFDVLDDCTRMLVACTAATGETAVAAITAITAAADRHGPPAIVLCDNGAAFTNTWSSATTGPSPFASTVNGWGTRLIHSSPYHPQTCGKVERHHQTLKRWLTHHRTPTTIGQLQRLLDDYRDYYNTRRAHSALPRRTTPHHAWTTAAHHGGPAALPIQTDATVHRCRVADHGKINAGSHRIGVGMARLGQTLTVIRHNGHATVYDRDGHPIGTATLTPGKTYVPLQPTQPRSKP
jgi:putative transposase